MERKTNHPHYGEVIYDEAGLPKCHICGKSFKKLMTHVVQKHGILAYDYKYMFGLNTTKGIIAESTKMKLQTSVLNNFDRVVKDNLINKGKSTRYTQGSKGRTRDKLSAQERRRIVNMSRSRRSG